MRHGMPHCICTLYYHVMTLISSCAISYPRPIIKRYVLLATKPKRIHIPKVLKNTNKIKISTNETSNWYCISDIHNILATLLLDPMCRKRLLVASDPVG